MHLESKRITLLLNQKALKSLNFASTLLKIILSLLDLFFCLNIMAKMSIFEQSCHYFKMSLNKFALNITAS